MVMQSQTGKGHQLQKDARSFESCRQLLFQAAGEIVSIENDEARALWIEIHACAQKAQHLSYSLEESLNQDI